MSTEKLVVTLITSPVLTVLVTEAIRGLRRRFDRKKNKGFARVEKDLSGIKTQMAKVVNDLDASKETEKVLLHDRLWQAFHFFQDKEEISVEDRANIDYLYAEYEKKNGNHKAKVMYEYIKGLPVLPETEEGEIKQ